MTDKKAIVGIMLQGEAKEVVEATQKLTDFVNGLRNNGLKVALNAPDGKSWGYYLRSLSHDARQVAKWYWENV